MSNIGNVIVEKNVTITLEDTTITLIWGDRKSFQKRCNDYAEITGANIRMVIPMFISMPNNGD